jgi:methylphosphotriester-DNA--protein-cysteine methyltransferase
VELSIDLLATLRVAVLLAAFGVFTWALLRMRREHAEQLERVHVSQRELAAQVHTLAERTAALATLVAALPRQAERTPEAPQHIRPRAEAAPVRSYETARRLARAGASIDEIVASSGLASSEARLLRRLHGNDPDHGNVA